MNIFKYFEQMLKQVCTIEDWEKKGNPMWMDSTAHKTYQINDIQEVKTESSRNYCKEALNYYTKAARRSKENVKEN